MGEFGPTTTTGSLNSQRQSQCFDLDKEHYPSNSRFVVTKKSLAYEYTPDPACWLPDCKKRNNHLAFRACSNLDANDWNVLGVNSMERYLDGDWNTLPGYNSKSLQDAIWYFKNATSVDAGCAQAWFNLAVAQLQHRDFQSSIESLQKAESMMTKKSDLGLIQLLWGLAEESLGKKDASFGHYDKMREINPETERHYWGVAMTVKYRQELTSHGTDEPVEALRAIMTFVHFSPVSIGDWALLLPGTQDWFLEHRYIVLRKVVPPFVLNAASRYFRQLIDHGVLKLGDTQAKRYVAYNDRVGRFIQNHITQMVRKITAHNAKPSYTYFGGYVPGATLAPHTDRSQCEFTISMNIEQHPHNETWLLSLDKLPLFDKVNKDTRATNVKTDDETRIADADLYAGDALLFMGRHLIHFRRGALPEGQWTNQVFMHFVQEGFSDVLN